MHIDLVKLCQFVLNIFSGNEIIMNGMTDGWKDSRDDGQPKSSIAPLYKLRTCIGAQRLSGRVLDSRSRGRGMEPHRRHCVVVLEQDTFTLATYWLNPGRPVSTLLQDC